MSFLNTGENISRKETGAAFADTITHSSAHFAPSCGVWLAGAQSSESPQK